MSSSGNLVPEPPAAPLVKVLVFHETGRRAGAAFLLILVLAALLSSIVVAFLFLSSRRLAAGTSDEAEKRAAALALVAQSSLIGSLKNEMAAGFSNPVSPAAALFLQTAGPAGPVNILYPANASAAVPGRTALVAPPNLLKWSSRFFPFYTETTPGTYPWRSRFPPSPPASTVSTLEKSINGKAVSEKRWNATWLLPKRLPSSADPSPQPFPVPDWIYMTTRGEQRTNLRSQKDDPISGRYAFLVFDEGGLLDASIAGFASTLDPSVVAAKTSTRVADLRPLLEAGGFSPAEAARCNDAFIEWRDPVFFGLSAADYSRMIALSGPPTPGKLHPGNRAPVSRQSLIRLFLERLPGSLAPRQNVLQYLGTFSRSLAQPQLALEWPHGTPRILPTDDGGNDMSGWNEQYPNQLQHINPPFALIRVRTRFLRADGTVAAVGEPLVKRRFSLTLLNLIERNSTAATGVAVERLFGLSREKPEDDWLYRPTQKRILTLNEVADLPLEAAREPDFLELLKASILAGALAKNSGVSTLPSDDSLDEAVVQIAANIIDQADEDAYPTRIRFEGMGGAKVFSGIENLPFLSGVRTQVSVLREAKPTILLRAADGTPSHPCSKTVPTDLGRVVMWQALQLWNPHERSSAGASQRRPTEFRVSAKASDEFGLQLTHEDSLGCPGATVSGTVAATATAGPKILGPQIRFSLPLDGAAFQQPDWLDSPDDPSGLELVIDPENVLSAVGFQDVNGNPILGVGLALGDQVFQTGVSPNRFTVRASFFAPDTEVQMSYRLEYNRSAAGEEPQWISYDEKVCPPLSGVTSNEFADFSYWPDPRTGRFGPFLSTNSLSEAQLRARFFVNSGAGADDYLDADGVRRGGTGASGSAASPLSPGGRPRVLDRPFRSVGELAFAFAGTPWRQLDFATPESGFSGLLEVFCVGENPHPTALEVGRVNLNTRQVPVLQAVLAGADLGTGTPQALPLAPRGEFSAFSLAQAIVTRTSGLHQGNGPLRDLSDLVGRRGADGKYTGVASELKSLFLKAPNGGTSLERHAIARTLGACGDTRVWNLLLDIIAQSGRCPSGSEASGELRNFFVEAERRIWVHVALDRLTGEVLDLQTEDVLE